MWVRARVRASESESARPSPSPGRVRVSAYQRDDTDSPTGERPVKRTKSMHEQHVLQPSVPAVLALVGSRGL